MSGRIRASEGDTGSLGDLAQAQAQAAGMIAVDRIAIELERTASDVPAFEPGAPHALAIIAQNLHQ